MGSREEQLMFVCDLSLVVWWSVPIVGVFFFFQAEDGIRDLTVTGVQTCALPISFGVDLHGIQLDVRAGEVVGIAGVSGNGQKELLYALSGEDTRAAPEMVQIAGREAGRLGPGRRRALGLHFVPEERLGRGAVPSMGLAHNLLLTRKTALGAGGWIRMRSG